MSTEANKAIVRRLMEEVFNQGHFTVADEIVAADYSSHDPLPGEGPGRAGMVANIQAIRSAFPDVRFEAEHVLAEGDKVAIRWRAAGTHHGAFIGIPATGKTSVTTGMTMYRIAGGQIVESWNNWDALGMMQQLGVLPMQPPPAKTFQSMADEAYRAVPTIKATDLQRRLQREPNLLVIDVRDAADIAQTGTVPGAINISYGALTYMADHDVPEDWRDPRLADRARPIITTCIMGPLGALGGKLLHDMGFSNVHILEGGVQAWIDAGLPVKK